MPRLIEAEDGGTKLVPKGNECQCCACGRFFSSLTGFDLHQYWTRDEVLYCLDPIELGLAEKQLGDGLAWRMPGQDEDAPEDEPGVATLLHRNRKAAIARLGL